MEGNRKEIRIRPARQEDLRSVEKLLIASGLPPDGIDEHLSSMLIAKRENKVVATAGLEIYGDSALLRSVVVDPTERGGGLGQRITREAVKMAINLSVNRLFLLTETAERFFPKLGFQIVDRAVIPATVKSSLEFTSLCPDTALAMELKL